MSFDINRDLDIILITFNRINKLKEIVSDMLNYNSPIKNCCIKFLDNCSTDGTSKFLEELEKKYKNITHIRHKMNIGGNANIVRAFEYVSKKYFWILCDDDRLDFTYWEHIREALESNKYDLIQVYSDAKVTYGETQKNKLAKLILEIVFVPGAIYKSRNIISDVLYNSYINIYSYIPHMSLISKIVNDKKDIYFCPYDKNIVIQNSSEAGYFRGIKKYIHPFVKYMDLSIGFILSLQLFDDKKLRSKCLDIIRGYNGVSFQGYILNDLPYYWIRAGMYDNILPIYNICNDSQRKSFIELLFYIRNLIKTRESFKINNFHILYIYKINEESIFSFIGFSKTYYYKTFLKNEVKSLFRVIKCNRYIRFTFLFFINLTIKIN
ncbi:glycosyltransferase family 2 protein [Brachyspira aalborgi]|uniref:Glycosyltransferase family 2 protein n=1 Tax=Brachyspira aalborgi TaxID=29522 RepID=A0A5C8ETG2_9SPIR|nr:glycosyltransferase family 2 protein [Brachyspira aalborgi]TXJ39510.1 glycosyltransferase family 2 protein [Brachyspira aalborgi]